MGLGKTYSADYLIDSNGNTGVSGQVLISTATGIDWADGSAITGGPFLPLAGGRITGTNKIEFNNGTQFIQASDGVDLKLGASDDIILETNFVRYLGAVEYARITGGASSWIASPSTSKLGIGTTSPQKKLDVYLGTDSAVASIAGNISAGEYAGLHFGYSETGNSNYRHSAIVFERDDASHGDARGKIHILNSASGSASADLGDSRLTVLPSGNVGIGTTNPVQTLEIHDSDASGYTHFGIKGTGHKYVIGVGNDSVADVNDKLYFYDNDNSAFRLVLDTSGNFGIGTITPGAKLDIHTATNTNGLLIREDTDDSITHNFYIDSSDNAVGVLYADAQVAKIQLNTAGDSYFNGGKVGIGTTNPGRPLTINSDTAHKAIRILENDTGNESWDIGVDVDGDLNFFNSADTSPSVTFRDDGNVGIGKTPSEKLDVEGNIQAVNTAGTAVSYVDIVSGATWRLASNPTSGTNSYGLDIIKGSAGTDVKMSIDSSGNVGIGTTAPTEKLAVNGNIETTGASGKIGFNVGDAYGDFPHYGLGKSDGANPVNLAGYYGLTFGSDGAERMRITASGYTQIKAVSGASRLYLEGTNGTHFITGTSGGDLGFYNDTGSSYAMFIKSDGNVGIGTTAPEKKLHIKGATNDATPQILVQNGGTGDASVSFNVSGQSYVVGIDYDDSKKFKIASSGNLGSTDRITLLSTGQVGIGTIVPAAKLDVVVSNVSVTPNGDSSGVFRKNGNNYISILSGATNEGGVIFGNSADAADGWIAYKHGTGATDQAFAFGTANGERMRITKDGNVGIGTASPGYRLTVDNDAANTNNPALYVKNPNSSTAAVIAEFVGDSDSIQIKNIGTGDYAIYNSQQSNGIALFDGNGGVEIRYNGATVLEADSNGGVKVTGQLSATGDVVAYSSDERLKENIKPIESAVDKIKQLKGVTFDWNEKSEELGFEPSTKTNDVGVIAQDVEAVFPQLVQLAPFDIGSDEDGKATSKSGEDYKTVNYARLTAVLIEAVKEQQQQIDELKAKLDGITK